VRAYISTAFLVNESIICSCTSFRFVSISFVPFAVSRDLHFVASVLLAFVVFGRVLFGQVLQDLGSCGARQSTSPGCYSNIATKTTRVIPGDRPEPGRV
jgi:hypothetical protein